MAYLLFFLAALSAGLTWAALSIAAAARVQPGWRTRLLTAAGTVIPLVAWLPWLGITAVLAFGLAGPRLETNWFPQVVTVVVATLIGSVWMAVAGLRSDRMTGEPMARAWPLGRLAMAFVASKLAAACVLLALEQQVVSQAQFLRIEVANLMQNNLPPQVSDTDNAAPLYVRAFANLESDGDFRAVEQLLADNEPGLLDHPLVTESLARHTETLALLEQAASRDVCRFTRDWTRPSFAMLLPEIQAMRRAAGLVALAARHDAASGKPAAALAKAEMLGAFAQHAASEPLLITMLVGFALDAVADQTLADVLPALTAQEAELLAPLTLPDITLAMPRAFFGEEAFGLAVFADVIAGSNEATSELSGGDAGSAIGIVAGQNSPIGSLFRVFLIPADLAGYRGTMRKFQQLASRPEPSSWLRDAASTLNTKLRESPPGILCTLIFPALSSVFDAGFREHAKNACQEVLIAATRQRLATGSLPRALEEIEPQWLPLPPGDPFTGTSLTDREPLHYRLDEQGLSVWSVGPNGQDDGGPEPQHGDSPNRNNDDIGLTMSAACSGE